MALNPGVCPQCNLGMLRRGFGWPRCICMVVFLFLFFPLGIILALSPDYLYCEHCGARFD